MATSITNNGIETGEGASKISTRCICFNYFGEKQAKLVVKKAIETKFATLTYVQNLFNIYSGLLKM